MSISRTAKSAEFQIISWFLEAGWEAYVPVVDVKGIDLVVKYPRGNQWLTSIQIKHSQPTSKHQGRIQNKWGRLKDVHFHFLVLFMPNNTSGFVFPFRFFLDRGKTIDTLRNGQPRPLVRDFYFNLADIDIAERGATFVQHFTEVWLDGKGM